MYLCPKVVMEQTTSYTEHHSELLGQFHESDLGCNTLDDVIGNHANTITSLNAAK